jgi:hypothetical protein
MGLLAAAETVLDLTTKGLIRVRQSGVRETVELIEREPGA